MRLRFLFVRAAAGTLAVGTAAPVNLPYATQAPQIAASADADTRVRPMTAGASAQSGDVDLSDAGDQHLEARLLKIGAKGELPCDSGEWATSSLFGPHAALAEALGVTPAGTANGARDAALADALEDRPAAGAADFSGFGSVFGTTYNPLAGGGPGGLFAAGGTSGGPGGTGGGPTGGAGDGPSTGGGPLTTGGGPTGGGGTDIGGGGPSTDGGPLATGGGPTGGGTDTGGGNPFAGDGVGPTGGPFGPGDNITTSGPGTAGGPEGTGDGTTLATGDDGSTGDHPIGGFSIVQPNVQGAVPEPSSWATMLLGFGLIGGAMRAWRRKTRLA